MRKTRQRRRLIFTLVLGVGVAAAAIVSQVGLGGDKRVQIGNGRVSALTSAARVTDALPAEVLSYPFASHNFANVRGLGSRLLKTDGSLRLYAVPGKAGMVCLVEIDDLARTSGGACADRQVLMTSSIFIADRKEDGSQQVAGLVGDGHTYAEANGTRKAVENNVFVLRGVADEEVTIGSPTAEQTVELGD